MHRPRRAPKLVVALHLLRSLTVDGALWMEHDFLGFSLCSVPQCTSILLFSTGLIGGPY